MADIKNTDLGRYFKIIPINMIIAKALTVFFKEGTSKIELTSKNDVSNA